MVHGQGQPTRTRPSARTHPPTRAHPPTHPPRREGFSTKFGLVHVDFDDAKLPRTPKESARYLQKYVFSKSTRK